MHRERINEPGPDPMASTAPIKSAAAAIAEGTRQAMSADPSVFVIGEGVADPKRVFGTTAGLLEEFGADRVIETPVAESALTGIAIGAAMQGQRPILVHQRVEFALLAMEQLVNNAAKTHYVTNGVYTVPLVQRMVIGRGWGQGPAHSQSLEPLFAHIPGLIVAMPSSVEDAKGMLMQALVQQNPVLFLEHRWYHYRTGPAPDTPFTRPLEGSAILKKGRDVTLVGTSYSVYEALEAASILDQVGVSAEVVDLRMLRPLGLDSITSSVAKTGRLITIDTGWTAYGAGAEIIASITSDQFQSLKAGPVRLGLSDHPTPSSRGLTGDFYPSAQSIVEAACKMLRVGTDKLEAARNEALKRAEGAIPDIPNPAFKGPF